MKQYEAMTVLEAAKMMEENPSGAKKYFDRAVRAMQKRAKTFIKHNAERKQGFKFLSEAITTAKHYGISPETISLISYTLVSKRSSYSESLKLDKQVVRSLNEEFGKGFIKLDELEEFGEAMDAFHDSHKSKMYGSDTVAQDIIQEIRAGKVTNWREYFINYGKEGSVK